jgi:hypothetical protein
MRPAAGKLTLRGAAKGQQKGNSPNSPRDRFSLREYLLAIQSISGYTVVIRHDRPVCKQLSRNTGTPSSTEECSRGLTVQIFVVAGNEHVLAQG